MSKSVKFVKIVSPIAFAIVLSACGGGGSSFIESGSGVSDATDSTIDDIFNAGLDVKCSLSGSITSYAITNPKAATVENAYMNCIAGAPLTAAEADFLERFESILVFNINVEGSDGLTNLPYLPNLNQLHINKSNDDIIYSLSDITKISQYKTLEELSIDNHKIVDLTPLSGLSNLKELSLGYGSGNSTIKDISPIGNLTKLEGLTIENGGITNIDSLSGLTALKEVNLQGNKIVDISAFSNSSNTSNLNLIKNRIDDARVLQGWEGDVNLNDNCIPDSLFPTGTLITGQSSQLDSCDVYDARDPELMLMGSGSGTNFSENTLSIVIPTLTSGAKTAITASLVGPTGYLTDREATVTFKSTCIANGQSSITGPITTTTGLATAEYTAQDCIGEDVVKASTTIDGTSFRAESTITVTPAEIGSLEFVSSTPSSIGIKGSGANETSVITFIMKDNLGNPIYNRQTNFSLDSYTGGVSLDPTSTLSNSEGVVTTTIQSGTVPTTVRVLAEVDEEPLIKTQSEGLVISTGFSDQDSFTIATSVHNVEGLDYIDGEATITVSAADAYNNPVPEGTAIYFTPEGGKIAPSCLTNVEGLCSVKWTSTNPKPANGRVTVLASMLGNESFVDSNGNGLLDDSDTFNDMGEAFLDKNENDIFDGEDVLRDFNGNGQYDVADNEFNGVLCNPINAVNICSAQISTHARHDIVLIMSGPAENINITPASPDATSGYVNVSLAISDRNNQPIPAGSTIELSMIGGGSILTDSSITVLSTNHNGPLQYSIGIKGDEVEAGTAVFLSIKVTTPKGVITGRTYPVLMKIKPATP